MSNKKFVTIVISIFTAWSLFVYFSLRTTDAVSLTDREGIKVEQEISRRERAENRAHIIRLEAEVERLHKALDSNRMIFERLVKYLETKK